MARSNALLKEDYATIVFSSESRAGGGSSGSGRRKFTLEMSGESAKAFFEMREITDADSNSEVVRNAIRLHAYLLHLHQEGAEFFIHPPGGEEPIKMNLFVEVLVDDE